MFEKSDFSASATIGSNGQWLLHSLHNVKEERDMPRRWDRKREGQERESKGVLSAQLLLSLGCYNNSVSYHKSFILTCMTSHMFPLYMQSSMPHCKINNNTYQHMVHKMSNPIHLIGLPVFSKPQGVQTTTKLRTSLFFHTCVKCLHCHEVEHCLTREHKQI